MARAYHRSNRPNVEQVERGGSRIKHRKLGLSPRGGGFVYKLAFIKARKFST